MREHIPVPYDNPFQSILSFASRSQSYYFSLGLIYRAGIGQRSSGCVRLNKKLKMPRLEVLTSLNVVSRKVLNLLKRKASRWKGILRRKTAKIFVSRFLEFSLQKKPVQIFVYLKLISSPYCRLSRVCLRFLFCFM